MSVHISESCPVAAVGDGVHGRTAEENHPMVAKLHKVTPDLAVYCHDDCYADPWGPMPETVVLVHGALESSEAWRAWVPHLSRQYRVLRPDLRGHGQSTLPGRGYPWSVGGLVSDLIALLDAL